MNYFLKGFIFIVILILTIWILGGTFLIIKTIIDDWDKEGHHDWAYEFADTFLCKKFVCCAIGFIILGIIIMCYFIGVLIISPSQLLSIKGG